MHKLEEPPPFTYCGVDMFGPFVIKQWRNEIKCYGAMFVCMASRAVQIEITHNWNSDSFIQALRRVIARGTNFVGCENELRKAFKEMDNERIQSFMQSLGDLVRWIRNPPAASHMGGIWERQIRSACVILSSLPSTHRKSFDKESLLMLLAETERILNSQPLTVETISNPTSDFPFAPSNILTMKLKAVMPPPGNFSRSDLYCQKRCAVSSRKPMNSGIAWWKCSQSVAHGKGDWSIQR